LEPRWAPSVTARFDPLSGYLFITADGPGDTVQLDHSGSDFIVRDGSHELRFGDAPVHDIRVTLIDSHETLNIERTLANKPVDVAVRRNLDTINISPTARNLNTIQGHVSVDHTYDDPPPDSYDLEIFDQQNTANTTYSSSSYLTRSGSATIFWGRPANVRIDGGRGANTFNVIWDYPHRTIDTTSGGAEQDVFVRSTLGPLDIIGGSSTWVWVGERDSGGMQLIRGAVRVSGPGTVLVLDDIFDAASRTVTMGVSGSTGSVTGLAPAEITYTADINHLAVYGGANGNTFTVSDTLVWTILNTGGVLPSSVTVRGTSTWGPLDLLTNIGDTINITNAANRLDSIAHVTLNPPGSMTFGGTVNVNDSGFGGNEAYTVTGTTVTVRRAPGFLLTYNGIANLTLGTGPGDDRFNLESTSVSTAVTGGTGSNHYYVSPTAQSLATIAGPLTINSNSPGDVIVEYDNAFVDTYAIGDFGTTVGRLGPIPIINTTGRGAGGGFNGTIALYTDPSSAVTDNTSGATLEINPDPTPSAPPGPPGGPDTPSPAADTVFVQALLETVRRRGAAVRGTPCFVPGGAE
jgi:hypothetical protein